MSQNKKECAPKKLMEGTIPASLVGEIQKGIVSGSNVQQAKSLISKPKEQIMHLISKKVKY